MWRRAETGRLRPTVGPTPAAPGGGGAGLGGAIYSDGSGLALSGCAFNGNLAKGGNGGNMDFWFEESAVHLAGPAVVRMAASPALQERPMEIQDMPVDLAGAAAGPGAAGGDSHLGLEGPGGFGGGGGGGAGSRGLGDGGTGGAGGLFGGAGGSGAVAPQSTRWTRRGRRRWRGSPGGEVFAGTAAQW